jgi:hypothetical protein
VNDGRNPRAGDLKNRAIPQSSTSVRLGVEVAIPALREVGLGKGVRISRAGAKIVQVRKDHGRRFLTYGAPSQPSHAQKSSPNSVANQFPIHDRNSFPARDTLLGTLFHVKVSLRAQSEQAI